MTTDERLQQLEARIEALEGLVERLAGVVSRQRTAEGRHHLEDATAQPTRRPLPRRDAPQSAGPAPAATAPPPAAVRAAPVSPWLNTEQWIGQRGLLALGVFLLILATAYFLKLAFDRGWIAPSVRCAGGAFAGIAVAATGWELHRRDLKTYGAALIGGGGAIVYVAVWAAVRLYALLPPAVGLGLLTVTSLAIFALGRVIGREALAAAAAAGGFLAPVTLGSSGDPNLLLLYAAALAGGLHAASERHWRATTFLIALSFFTLGAASAGGAAPTNVLMYGVLGGSAGLYVGLRESWPETRLATFLGGWLLLLLAHFHQVNGRFLAVGAIILAAPIWWRASHLPTIWPREAGSEAAHTVSGGESFYFYVTPLLLTWGLSELDPAWFIRHLGVAPLIVAVPYLAMGYTAVRRPFALVGTSGMTVAAMWTWSGVGSLWALLPLALLWAALDHRLDRSDGRWYAVLPLAVALARLAGALPTRPAGTRAFLDHWALGLWAVTLAATQRSPE